MSGEELKTFFENLVDDEPDVTLTFQLLTQGKNLIERIYKPVMLINVDSTKTASPGDTYLSTKALPTDFREMLKLVVGKTQYFPVSFIQRIAHANSARRFYIDHKNSVFGLTGTVGSALTIHQHYLIKTTDLTVANKDSVIITWPSEFHPLAAYFAHGIYKGVIDPDSIAILQKAEGREAYDELLGAFIGWDADQKIGAMGDSLGYDPSEVDNNDVDLSLM